MELRPEQKQALVYLARRGTRADATTLRDKVRTTFTALDERLGSVGDAEAARRPAPGKWSVHEIVDHLVVSHRPAVREVAELVAGRRPEGGPIPAGLQSDDPFARPWSVVRDELARVHGDFLAVLEDADDEAPTDVGAPVLMVVKCATDAGGVEPVHWTQDLDWKAYAMAVRAHALEHLQQIERTLG